MFFPCTAMSQLHALSLHDALPISSEDQLAVQIFVPIDADADLTAVVEEIDDALAADLPEGLTVQVRSEEHTSELQSRGHLVCRLLLEKKKETQRRGATSSMNVQ